MARVPGCETVYAVANQWRERCLEQDGSLLWPDLEEPTWTVENLERSRDLMHELVKARKTTGGNMKDMLQNEPEAIKRTIADATTLWNLVPGSLRATSRLEFAKMVASWVESPPEFGLIAKAMNESIGSKEASFFLPGFQLQRGAHIRFILEFARRIKTDDVAADDLAALRVLALDVLQHYPRAHSARNMVLHLLFPDQYEAIFNNWAKEKIANAPRFRGFAEGIDEWDDRIAAIRAGLTDSGFAENFDFYDADIRALWRPPENETPEVLHFVDDTPGFLEWLETNPDGFVLNTRRNTAANDFVLHRASCGHLEFEEDVNLTGPYTKVCSMHPAALIDWARGRVGALATIRQCTTCRPDVDIAVVPDVPTGTSTALDLQSIVHFSAEDLTRLHELLNQKRQLIFEGPPGTGKTYVARLFARYLAGLPLMGPPDPQVEIVQFHQSYGYEDFVAGIRPSTTPEGTLRYDVQPGIFIEMCHRAQKNPERNFVLIIDEINRGNVSRIFGELLYALEYRDEPVRMQYPDLLGDADADHLVIPSNLYLIGTMNSTDRSLAMIDYALRRRFYFWKLSPVVEGRAPFLEDWLRSRSFAPEAIADIARRFVEINLQVSSYLSPDYAIGHSYFMDESIGELDARLRIWTYQLQPLLEEYFHSRRDRDDAIDTLRSIMLDA